MQQQLAEKYRPKTLDAIVGQERAVALLRRMQSNGGFGGQVFWFAAGTGTGKNCFARIIANEVSDEWGIKEDDAQDVNMEYMRAMEEEINFKPLWFVSEGKSAGKVWIINEAHGLPERIIRRFLSLIENKGKGLPENVVIIFTTTKDGADSLFEGMNDANPFLDRCIEVPMSSKGLKEKFAQRASEIADIEGLNGKPIAAYQRLAMDERNSLRGMLAKIQAGYMLD